MINGIINVYKEKGYTSFDVVAKLRGIFHMKKIGHTGTLDPDAEGVLPVCLGKATKVCDLLTDKDKEYEAVMLLGIRTDTQDISGNILASASVHVTPQQTADVIESFVGEYMQVPPMYSALKVNGKKLCDLARAGITVEREARPVQIYRITVQKIELPRVSMRVSCSKGTYIRTLCHDIGEKLGCGACMEALTRTAVSRFTVKDALRLNEIGELVEKEGKNVPHDCWDAATFSFIEPVDSVFMQYSSATVFHRYDRLLYNGNRLTEEMFTPVQEENSEKETDFFRIYDEEGHFIGIYERKEAEYAPVKIFMEL